MLSQWLDPVNLSVNSACALLLLVGWYERRLMMKRLHSLESTLDRHVERQLEGKT